VTDEFSRDPEDAERKLGGGAEAGGSPGPNRITPVFAKVDGPRISQLLEINTRTMCRHAFRELRWSPKSEKSSWSV
jgi:hypothetical protein